MVLNQWGAYWRCFHFYKKGKGRRCAKPATSFVYRDGVYVTRCRTHAHG